MGALSNIVIAVAALSFITFVALFGQLPALRRTPIGWLQRVLCLHIPNGLKAVDRHLTGGHITTKSVRLGHYLFTEKNAVVLVRYSIKSPVPPTSDCALDPLLTVDDRKCRPISVELNTRTTNQSNLANTFRSSPTLRLHLALRSSPRTPHHPFQPPSQASRLPI